jgi:hypothetical protein
LLVAASTEIATGIVHSVPRALHAVIGVLQLLHTLATRFLRPKDS